MNLKLQTPRRIHLVYLPLLLLSAAAGLTAQPKDKIDLIQSPGSRAYQCCYSFVVESRQTKPTTISEFHLKIVSGRGRIVTGTATSPANWTVFVAQDLKSVAWFASTAASEIDSGRSLSGFNICAADTGVMRFVWETRGLDTVYSSDTIAVACRGVDCDEAFFRQVPSSQTCAFDIDVVNGNRSSSNVNAFHLNLITPGTTFYSGPANIPPGWLLTRSNSDSMSYLTPTKSLAFGEFVEGFRVFINPPADGVFRVEWWTADFGTPLCRDTATLRCVPLAVEDSLRIRRSADSCCQDLTLRNIHQPPSTLQAFAIKTLTPGVRISPLPAAPAGWNRQAPSASGDSVAFTKSAGLAPDDTVMFRSVCFLNSAATTDTVRYRWETWSQGINVTRSFGSLVCVRPLTSCDVATVKVDSTLPATQRCMTFTLRNRNSRGSAIQRFGIRISNPGTARRILSALGSGGFQVTTVGTDSLSYSGGSLAAGDSVKVDFCVSNGDAATRDPLTVAWSTNDGTLALCSGQVQVNAIIVRTCDDIRVEPRGIQQPGLCCFTARFRNRNTQGRKLDGFQLEVADSRTIFATASAAAPWVATTTSFPNPVVGYNGAELAPGDSTTPLDFCIDVTQIPAGSVLPVIWRSYSAGSIVCSDTIRLTCGGAPVELCDTALLVSTQDIDNACSYAYKVANQHSPAGAVDAVRFRVTGGTNRFAAAFASGEAAGFTLISVRPDTVLFRGSTIAAADTVGDFLVRMANTDGPTALEVCTLNGTVPVCCDVMSVTCVLGGARLTLTPSSFLLYPNVPNPFGSTTTVGYQLRRSGEVRLTVRDASGREVRSYNRGFETEGEYLATIDADGLPAGIYFYTLHLGSESITRRMVILK